MIRPRNVHYITRVGVPPRLSRREVREGVNRYLARRRWRRIRGAVCGFLLNPVVSLGVICVSASAGFAIWYVWAGAS